MPNMQGAPQQAPGQAMMPGQSEGIASMLPQPGRGGPQAGVPSLTPALSQMDRQQLLMEFMNPGSRIPKFAVLSAIDQKAKQERTLQAVQGAAAQQQAQQQPETVAQEVLQGAMQPVMARHGGVMHSYNRGGVVAFQKGGMTDAQKAELMRLGVSAATIEDAIRQGLTYEDLRRRSFSVSQPVTSVIASPEEQVVPEEEPLEQRMARSAGIKKVLRVPEITPAPVMKNLIAAQAPAVKDFVTDGKPDFYKQQFEDPDAFMRELAGDTRQLPQTPLPPDFVLPRTPAPAPAPRADARAKVRPPAPAPAPAPVASRSAGTSGLAALVEKDIPEVKEAYDKVAAAAGLTPEQQRMLEAKQQAEMDARRAAEAARKARADESLERSAKSYANVLAGQDGLFGPRGLFELAASIDPRRGYIFGSLAKGAAGVLAREQEEKKKAQTAYELAQQKFSEELNALDNIKLATAERDTAILSNNMNAAREAEAKRAQLVIDYNRLKRERAVAERNAAIEAHKAESTRISAQASATSAAKPSEMEFAAENPEAYARIQKAKAEALATGKGLTERQDVAELKALISTLKDQADPTKNFDKTSREDAARLLKQAQNKLAQMSGIDVAAPAGVVDTSNPLLK